MENLWLLLKNSLEFRFNLQGEHFDYNSKEDLISPIR